MIAGSMPPLVIPSVGDVLTKVHDNEEVPLLIRSQRITTRKKQTKPVLNSKVPHSIIGVSFLIMLPGISCICLQNVRPQY